MGLKAEKPMKRVALSPTVSRGDVETAAWDLDFILNNRIERHGDQAREDIWASIDGETFLYEIEDHISGLRYLVVRGREVDETVDRLRDRLNTVTLTDALHALGEASSFDDKLLAVYQLGIAAPPHANSDVIAAFERMLTDDDPELRLAMKSEVKRVSKKDPDESVR